jgi:hypothetical protein
MNPDLSQPIEVPVGDPAEIKREHEVEQLRIFRATLAALAGQLQSYLTEEELQTPAAHLDEIAQLVLDKHRSKWQPL